jgi:hypothetical protein
VVSAESLLIHVLQRARELTVAGVNVYATPALKVFLGDTITKTDFEKNTLIDDATVLNWYAALDDSDISIALKVWQTHPDPVLSKLSQSLMNRKLFKINLSTTPFEPALIKKINTGILSQITDNKQLAPYFIMTGEITNKAYNKHNEKILVLNKSGVTKDMEQASDINLTALTKTVRKYYLCYPKELVVN